MPSALSLRRMYLPAAPDALWRPAECLRPVAMQAARLITSTGQVAIHGGRSMRQLSLTDYFEALHRLTCDGGQTVAGGSAVFFPVRSFNPEALVALG